MVNKNYFNFIENLNENIQQAKVYLKNLALKRKKQAAGEGESVTLSPDEVRAAETNPNFLKIKDLCKDVPGYTFLFTKIYFDELEPNQDYTEQEKFNSLKTLFDRVKSLGNLVKDLPMPLDRYAAIKPTEEDQRPISERIDDDIDKLLLEKSYRKFYNELLTPQKKWVEDATKQQQERLRQVGIAFGEMGKDDSGKVDTELQKSLHRVFYSKLKDFKKLDDLIDYAINYVKSVNNNQFSKFIKKIDEVNMKFGPNNGASIIYDKDGYLVIEVKTYIANRELNGHTSHCIARSQSYWDNYLEDYNKQYYVYNFNLDPTDPKSVIGMTIRPSGDIRAAHDKVDSNVSSSFKSKMSEWKIPFEVFAPMSKEEQVEKKKRIEASRKIVDPSLTLELAEECLNNGADPNAKNGLPLKNAVKANNKDLVKLLLQRGAMPNISDQSSSETAISNAADLEMVKILVSAGATLNSGIFRKLATDYDAVKYLLEAGLDPNFDRGFPLRAAAKSGDVEIMKLLLQFADNIKDEKLSVAEKQFLMIKERRWMALKWCVDSGKVEATLFLLDTINEINKTIDDSDLKDFEKFCRNLIDYVSDSDGISADQKKEMIVSLQGWINQNLLGLRESKRFKSFRQFI